MGIEMHLGLHEFQEMREEMVLNCVSLDEVADLLISKSPFAGHPHERMDRDLIKFLQTANDYARKGALERNDYILAVTFYQFLVPILGVNVEKERANFCEIMKKMYKVENPLLLRFREIGEEKIDSEDPSLVDIDKVVEDISSLKLFEHEFKGGGKRWDYSDNFSNKVKQKSNQELMNLERSYSTGQHILVVGYCFVLSPSVGIDPKKEYKQRYERVIKENGVKDYCLFVPELTKK
jgi:hypothetical protein